LGKIVSAEFGAKVQVSFMGDFGLYEDILWAVLNTGTGKCKRWKNKIKIGHHTNE
jgi:hypothetical protein